MYYQRNLDWHLLADRFVWYEYFSALSLIPKNVTDDEVQKYLYFIHGDYMSIEEIKKWRKEEGSNTLNHSIIEL